MLPVGAGLYSVCTKYSNGSNLVSSHHKIFLQKRSDLLIWSSSEMASFWPLRQIYVGYGHITSNALPCYSFANSLFLIHTGRIYIHLHATICLHFTKLTIGVKLMPELEKPFVFLRFRNVKGFFFFQNRLFSVKLYIICRCTFLFIKLILKRWLPYIQLSSTYCHFMCTITYCTLNYIW